MISLGMEKLCTMEFEAGNIYHVYNQGNNRQRVFFSDRNYEYFIRKVKMYVCPYADILAWCLMPNHFHMMVFVKFTHRVTSSHPVSKLRTINDSIAIMLRSYTRGVNNELNRSGSLFREDTKAVCLTMQDGVTPSWYTHNGITHIFNDDPEKEYTQVCFNYIHQNPVSHGFVFDPNDWHYSSFSEYSNTSGKAVVNKARAEEYDLFIN